MKRTVYTDLSEADWKKLRSLDITSTEIGGLFGLQSASYIPTEFELYHRKKDRLIVEMDPNERTTWGTRLQDSIAAGIASDQGWKIRKMTEYITTDLRMGSSFDFCLIEGPNHMDAIPGVLLEIKNVDSLTYRDGWLVEDDNIEAPPHIELQVQHQLAVSGFQTAYIGALVGGNRVILIKRERDEKIIASIKRRVTEFWAMVDSGQEPQPDFERDAEFIRGLYQYAEPGTIYSGGAAEKIERLVQEYSSLGQHIKELDTKRAGIKAELLTEIGEAEKFKGATCSISAGVIGAKEISYTRSAYRDFRCFMKKEKA